MNKRCFTLAEVLVTLSIVAVVAVLLISSIISHYKKLYTEVRLKQIYSILDNTLDIAKINNMSSLSQMAYDSVHNTEGMSSGAYFLENYIAKYVNLDRKCYNGSTSCRGIGGYTLTGDKNGDFFKDLNGIVRNESYYLAGNSQIVLKNGIAVSVALIQDSGLVYMRVDINGKKAPNQLGHDIFAFSFLPAAWCKNDILITAQQPSCDTKNTKCEGTGLGCAAPIQKNNWKIPQNYPVKF